MKAYHVGIDYHKRYSTVCVLDDAGNVVVEGTVQPNSKEKFAAFFQGLGGDAKVRVVYECGLNWGELGTGLKSEGRKKENWGRA